MEMDDEVKGNTGTSYTTEFRQYDPRVGRWFSVDPLAKVQASQSPYNFANNTPIIGSDPKGDICIPCIALVLGLGTFPSIAVAPTGNSSDVLKVQEARELQAKWLVYTLFASGAASGIVTKEVFMKELAGQYGTQLAVQSYNEYSENGKININTVMIESAKNLDMFDAVFSRISGNKIWTSF
jgi:RHS repeat-associated protein